MKNKMGKRAAKKFEYFYAKKAEQMINATSSTSTTFSIHSISQSQAEILLPFNSPYHGKQQEQIIQITIGKITFYAEMSDSSFSDKQFQGISILQNLVNLAGVPLDSSGKFKGELICIDKERIPKEYMLEYAEILVKNIYLSRRDQYKVLNNLSNRGFVHVYNRKNLYFDKLQLEFTNLLHKDDQIRKTGILTKNTKIIFRSSCSKYTILIQISKEMFELNEQKELYLEKAIHFLLIFFQRNTFFNTKHRIQIVLFARLFYPQFKTLKEVYEQLGSEGKFSNSAFTTNYASAFQKDYKGRVFQDVYRRILWPSGSTTGFRQKFWERVSEFMFTLNWADTKTYAKNINKSVEENISKQIYENKKSIKIYRRKPFLHRLKSQLSTSEESCFFEAISLISEQYKHHYYFRSLEETGNAITVVSAGKSFYKTDETTYKMAKSNIYLTNINCIHINLKRKEPNVTVKIVRLIEKPLYNKEDAEKLRKLIDWCIEEDVYISPTNILLNFTQDFQMKSVIYPRNLKLINQQEMRRGYSHFCYKKEHYANIENPDEEVELVNERIERDKQRYARHGWMDKEKEKEKDKSKGRELNWISTYYMNEKAYQVHKLLYDNFNFDVQINGKKKFEHVQESEFKTFVRDLSILVNKKNQYNFTELCHNSEAGKKAASYVKDMRYENIEEIRQFIQKEKNEEPTNDITIQLLDPITYEDQYVTSFFVIESIADTLEESPSPPNSPWDLDGLSDDAVSVRKKSDDFCFYPVEELESKKRAEVVNIIDETMKCRDYTLSAASLREKKRKSHNKERLVKNYEHSTIHYMMYEYNEKGNQWLNRFIEIPEARNEHERMIKECIELEKEWKNIIFPILTPIYTNYKGDRNCMEANPERSESGKTAIEDEVCRNLMQNFQIEASIAKSSILMSKGHVHMEIKICNPVTAVVFEYIDEKKQEKIIPKMLYRYLVYEEKDYRFSSKSIIFTNQNFYNKTNKIQQKKSLKLVMLDESNRGDGACFQEFIKMLSDKYKQVKIELRMGEDCKGNHQRTEKFSINMADHEKHKIYTKQIIQISLDLCYHPSRLYEIHIEWDYCCATFVQQFVEACTSAARKNKITSFQMGRNNAFDTTLTISTIGEIFFSSETALSIFETDIINNKEWLWDNEGYYMDRNGEAFIRFIHDKNLIEWKDNLLDKNKWKKVDSEASLYEIFFMKSAAYDFIGGIIDSFTNTNSRKNSIALST